VFRWAVVFIPLKFQRTRSEEILFALWISVFPLVAAICIDLTFWGRPSLASYRQVFAASYSEAIFEHQQKEFWIALQDVLLRQGEFLSLYYTLVIFETVIFVKLINNYGNWRGKSRIYERFVQQVLLRSVSEWHVLLTLFNFPDVPKLKVAADVLTDGDRLYQGDVAAHFIDSEGALSGLILENPRRFDRARYLRDKEKNDNVKAEKYWREVPSSNLYIPREKVINLNLRYPRLEPQPTEAETAVTATEELSKEGIDLRVEISRESPSDDPTR
jgi:hypothetical protein